MNTIKRRFALLHTLVVSRLTQVNAEQPPPGHEASAHHAFGRRTPMEVMFRDDSTVGTTATVKGLLYVLLRDDRW